MKKEKLNLKSIKNVLSRGELKQIMAGSDPNGGGGGNGCTNNLTDSTYNCCDSTGFTVGTIQSPYCRACPTDLARCQETYPYGNITQVLGGPC